MDENNLSLRHFKSLGQTSHSSWSLRISSPIFKTLLLEYFVIKFLQLFKNAFILTCCLSLIYSPSRKEQLSGSFIGLEQTKWGLSDCRYSNFWFGQPIVKGNLRVPADAVSVFRKCLEFENMDNSAKQS